jgi:hypothetical protein
MMLISNIRVATDTAPNWAAIIFRNSGFTFESTSEIQDCECLPEHKLSAAAMEISEQSLAKAWEDEPEGLWEQYLQD